MPASSGDFERLHAQRNSDVIVLDVKIADFDGLHLLARLAQLPATRKIRKLVYSAAEHMRTRALDAGASAFVVKADVQKLQEALLSFAVA